MIPDLVQVIVGTQPNETYLHLQLLEHGQDTWSGSWGIREIPCVRLSQLGRSPAAKALEDYRNLQTSPAHVSLSVLEGLQGVDINRESAPFLPATCGYGF